MNRNHLSLSPTPIHTCIPFLQMPLSLSQPLLTELADPQSHIPGLGIPGPFSRDQLALPSCPVARPLPAAIGPNSKSTVHLAPVCDVNPDPDLHYSLSLLGTAAPAWGQTCTCLLSFWPLTGHTVRDCHLRFLSFSSHCALCSRVPL